MNARPNDSIVRKSNALARAKWLPDSVWEPRIIAILASKIDQNDIDFQTYDISIVEIIGKNPGGKDYKEIENIIDKAMSRIITIRNGDNWKKYTLFSSCELVSKSGLLKIGFHPDLREHFLHLKQYIKYNINEFMMLPSIYSQRLFEILKSWTDKDSIILAISELHEILDVPKSLKNKYKDFRVRVLDKAYIDINKYTALKYSWEPIKTGRTVTDIRFIFKKDISEPSTNHLVNITSNTHKNVIKPKFDDFLEKFSDARINHIHAGIKWLKLNSIGIAPLAEDVPDNNTLGVIEFLQYWQDKKQK